MNRSWRELCGLHSLLGPWAPVQVGTWTAVLVVSVSVVDVGGVVDGVAQVGVNRVGIVVGLVAAGLRVKSSHKPSRS